MLAVNFAAVQMSAGRLLDTVATSPTKTSPKKRVSPVKENLLPTTEISMSFSSPTKKPASKDLSEERRSRRRTPEQDLDDKYLEGPESPTKRALPKSPVKRMRQLEKQAEQQEPAVDVETAYKASPQKVVQETENQVEDADEARAIGKTLLAEINGCQEKIQTPAQVKATPEVDINAILDVDSNVINYG